MTSIDLNADLGEGCPDDAALLKIVSSCNVACGGHAGDRDSMVETVRLAMEAGVAVGAHPSYPDREGFGRRSRFLTGDKLADSLHQQVEAIRVIANEHGLMLSHVKPHGALYNDAAKDPELAEQIAASAGAVDGDCAVVGPPHSALEVAAKAYRLPFIAEAFVDRGYEPDGSLVPRSEPGAVHTDPAMISMQALSLAKNGRVTARDGSAIDVRADTLCIHGDTPGAAESAAAVRDVLETNGIEIRAPGARP